MAYRSVSTEALYVIAGMMAIECWGEERIDRFRYGMNKKEERKYQLDKWQKKWEQETGKAKWTKKLIPNVREWIIRKDGEITFRLTQFLSGHEAFGKYKERMGKVEYAIFLCRRNEGKSRGVENEL
mgnify:CR=1 FL=1